MSSNNAPTHNVVYDPLPLTNDDYSNNPYNVPPSPEPGLSMFHTPQMDPRELGPDEYAIPPGAAQPRFLGAALYDGSGSPSMRNSFASSSHTIPGTHSEYNSSLYTLNDPHSTGYHDDPRDLVSGATGRTLEEKRAAYAPKSKSTRKVMIAAIIVALALIIAAVVIPLYLFVIKPSHSNDITKATVSSSAPTPSASASSGGSSNVRVTGGDGSIVTLENGTTFTYQNPFGGYWYWDENDPLNQYARAQSWSPALNETFNYGVDQVRGSVFRL
jgi:glucan 1,3-beta-glucosidase